MNKLSNIIFAFGLLLRLNGAFALEVIKCQEDTPTNAEYIGAMKEYYQGAVKVFLVDTLGEPACCSSSLVIYLPKLNAELAGESECYWVVNAQQMGFMSIDFKKIKSDYNPLEGLTLAFPYSLYSDIYGEQKRPTPYSRVGKIIINLVEGTVKAVTN